MNYRTLILLLLTFCLVAPLSAQGTVKRAKKRTERRVDQRVDQKIDEQVDKAFTAIEGLFSKKKQGSEGEPGTASEGDAPASSAAHSLPAADETDDAFQPYENEHPFSLTMKITEKKRNKEQLSTMRMAATTDQVALLTGDLEGEGSAHMIFNSEDGKTTMITTDRRGKTQGFRIRMPNLGRLTKEVAEDVLDHLTITRTGERRTIDGYACELVVVENTREGTTTRSWITFDLELNGQEVFGSISRMMGGGAAQSVSLPPGMADVSEGFPIQTTTVDGNTTYEMHLTDIRTGDDIDRSLFDTGGVEILEVGF